MIYLRLNNKNNLIIKTNSIVSDSLEHSKSEKKHFKPYKITISQN